MSITGITPNSRGAGATAVNQLHREQSPRVWSLGARYERSTKDTSGQGSPACRKDGGPNRNAEEEVKETKKDDTERGRTRARQVLGNHPRGPQMTVLTKEELEQIARIRLSPSEFKKLKESCESLCQHVENSAHFRRVSDLLDSSAQDTAPTYDERWNSVPASTGHTPTLTHGASAPTFSKYAPSTPPLITASTPIHSPSLIRSKRSIQERHATPDVEPVQVSRVKTSQAPGRRFRDTGRPSSHNPVPPAFGHRDTTTDVLRPQSTDPVQVDSGVQNDSGNRRPRASGRPSSHNLVPPPFQPLQTTDAASRSRSTHLGPVEHETLIGTGHSTRRSSPRPATPNSHATGRDSPGPTPLESQPEATSRPAEFENGSTGPGSTNFNAPVTFNNTYNITNNITNNVSEPRRDPVPGSTARAFQRTTTPFAARMPHPHQTMHFANATRPVRRDSHRPVDPRSNPNAPFCHPNRDYAYPYMAIWPRDQVVVHPTEQRVRDWGAGVELSRIDESLEVLVDEEEQGASVDAWSESDDHMTSVSRRHSSDHGSRGYEGWPLSHLTSWSGSTPPSLRLPTVPGVRRYVVGRGYGHAAPDSGDGISRLTSSSHATTLYSVLEDPVMEDRGYEFEVGRGYGHAPYSVHGVSRLTSSSQATPLSTVLEEPVNETSYGLHDSGPYRQPLAWSDQSRHPARTPRIHFDQQSSDILSAGPNVFARADVGSPYRNFRR